MAGLRRVGAQRRHLSVEPVGDVDWVRRGGMRHQPELADVPEPEIEIGPGERVLRGGVGGADRRLTGSEVVRVRALDPLVVALG